MNLAQTIWRQLREKNLVEGEFHPSSEIDSPWFIKVLLALSGWFASIFIFGFCLLILHDLIDNSVACTIVGTGLIFIAYKTLKKHPNDFLEHLMLSCSLAGQALIAWAFFITLNSDASLLPWLAILIMQSILSLVMPHYIHQICSAFFASIAFVICLHYLQLTVFACASLLLLISYLVLNEWRSVKSQPTFEAISYGAILVLIPLQASFAIGYETSYWLEGTTLAHVSHYYVDELLLLLTMLYIVISLIKRSQYHFPRNTKIMMIGATICLSLLSTQASGITLGFAIVILGFSNSNKVLQGLGVAALLFYISSYYYLLALTLLEKAGILLLMGLFILLIRFSFLKWFNPTQQGEQHAI